MELIRWRPRRYVPAVSPDIDRVFDGLMRNWVRPGSLSEGGWNPSIDVSEKDGEIVVSAEVPGIDPKDIDISIDDNRLVISGEKSQEDEERGKNYYRVERSYGSFSRSFSLPSNADVENIKASSRDGVLSVRIPKREDDESKRVEIEVQ